ncbi:MAG: energy-coupling factor ABC transporter permease [Moorellales bacterium]
MKDFARRYWIISATVFAAALLCPGEAHAMHIMEGFLPPVWAFVWALVTLPFLILGMNSVRRLSAEKPEAKLLLGVSGAFIFVLSALKLPSVTGSCSHPTGVGLGTVLFGPWPMSVLGLIVLLFQALLLAHGGITTLGANTFSMAVVGPLVGYGAWCLCRRLGLKTPVGVFAAAALADLSTYAVTSLQLALAFPAPQGGVMASLAKFTAVFAVTQVPLAVSEALVTVVVFNLLEAHLKSWLSLPVEGEGERS